MEVGEQVSPWESQDDTLPLQVLQVQKTPEGVVWEGQEDLPSLTQSPSEAPLRTAEEGAAQDSLSLPLSLSLSLSIARTHTDNTSRRQRQSQAPEKGKSQQSVTLLSETS